MSDKYKLVNGTSYYKNTPDVIISILENARKAGTRLHLHYGDNETGKDWLEECDVRGTIGRSSGIHKIPILLATKRSLGGGAVLSENIVKIRNLDTKKTVYIHEKYNHGEIKIRGTEVFCDGIVHARFKNEDQVRRWIKKMGLEVS